jgi:hypothetical protein
VYLAQLLKKIHYYASKVGIEVREDNASIKTFLEKNIITPKEPLPPSTPHEQLQQPLFFDVVRSNSSVTTTETVVLYDVAGEVFVGSNTVRQYAPFIKHADGIVLLLDPKQFEDVNQVVSGGITLKETSSVLDAINNIISNEKIGAKCTVPIAVCVSKIDEEEVQALLSDDLKELLKSDVKEIIGIDKSRIPVFNAKEYNPIAKKLYTFISEKDAPLYQKMKNSYANYSYFAFTALGCDTVVQRNEQGVEVCCPEGPILPKRIEEPIIWLLHKFGYIGTNEVLYSPMPKTVLCNKCGDEMDELQNSESKIKGCLWWKKTVYYKYKCKKCGNRREEN